MRPYGYPLGVLTNLPEPKPAALPNAVAGAFTPGVAGCDLFEMGSGNVGISVGEVSAVFNPLTSVLRYTSGNRAPVMITGNGRVHELPTSRTDFTLTLSRGTSCLFYGPKSAPQAIEQLPLGQVVSAENSGASLALHHVARPDTNFEVLEYSAHPVCASLAREAMSLFAIRHGMSPDREYELSYAVGEAVANAIEYCIPGADATFKIDAIVDSERVIIHVENSGCWRASIPSDERGRGISIMAACSTALEIDSSDDRTRITLSFQL